MAKLHSIIYESPTKQDGAVNSFSDLKFYIGGVPTIHFNDPSHLEIYPVYSDGAPLFCNLPFQSTRQCHGCTGGPQGPGDAIQDEHPVDQPQRVKSSSHHNLYAIYGCGKLLPVVLDIRSYLV